MLNILWSLQTRLEPVTVQEVKVNRIRQIHWISPTSGVAQGSNTCHVLCLKLHSYCRVEQWKILAPPWLTWWSLIFFTISSMQMFTIRALRLAVHHSPSSNIWDVGTAEGVGQLSQPNKNQINWDEAFCCHFPLIWWSALKGCSADLAQAIFSCYCGRCIWFTCRLW